MLELLQHKFALFNGINQVINHVISQGITHFSRHHTRHHSILKASHKASLNTQGINIHFSRHHSILIFQGISQISRHLSNLKASVKAFLKYQGISQIFYSNIKASLKYQDITQISRHHSISITQISRYHSNIKISLKSQGITQSQGINKLCWEHVISSVHGSNKAYLLFNFCHESCEKTLKTLILYLHEQI